MKRGITPELLRELGVQTDDELVLWDGAATGRSCQKLNLPDAAHHISVRRKRIALDVVALVRSAVPARAERVVAAPVIGIGSYRYRNR